MKDLFARARAKFFQIIGRPGPESEEWWCCRDHYQMWDENEQRQPVGDSSLLAWGEHLLEDHNART